jgi:membrane protease YdiL (CAAX protease family)
MTATPTVSEPFPQTTSVRRDRTLAEIFLILATVVVALVVGSLADVFLLGPIGIVAAAALSLWLVRRRGEPFAAIGLRRASWWRTALLTVAGWAGVTVVVAGVATVMQVTMGLSPDVSALGFVEGNLAGYLGMLAIGWTTAAIGEEIVFRGFLLQRIERLVGAGPRVSLTVAIVAQGALFGLAHSYQGLAGALQVLIFGVAIGALFVLTKRNLWVCILTHGVTDTVGLTALYFGVMPGA